MQVALQSNRDVGFLTCYYLETPLLIHIWASGMPESNLSQMLHLLNCGQALFPSITLLPNLIGEILRFSVSICEICVRIYFWN